MESLLNINIRQYACSTIYSSIPKPKHFPNIPKKIPNNLALVWDFTTFSCKLKPRQSLHRSYWLFFNRGRLWSGSTLERKFCQLISHLLRTSFLLGTKFSKEPLLPILFLVEVILSATYFGHIILLSSSWSLKHQSKESQDLILLNTYLNIFFKIFRKTSTSVWTSSHFPSSSWGLKHQSKESYVLIAAEYLSKYFLQNSQETSTSVWTSNHFKELSNQPPFLPSFLKYSTLYIRSW